MSKAAFPEGIQPWPIERWENGHQNFVHTFKKGASFKITLPDSLPGSAEKYKATTKNFMWLIQYAIDHNLHMRAMGNGWSLCEVAVSDGAVDTKSLRLSFVLKNSFVAPDYLNKGKQAADLFFVQCGMSILQINEKLEAAGRSLKASGASNGQSIAGATSTGTHGAAYHFGAVHDAIVGLHIVTGANEHVWVERKSNPVASDEFIAWMGAKKINDNDDFFNAAVVSFGSFGFIHGILLETAPIFLLEEHRSGEIAYDAALIKAMNTLDLTGLQKALPYPEHSPGKDLYHFEVLVNPHDFEPNNPDKGVFLKTLYQLPYTPDYPHRERSSKGFVYGDNTLGVMQTILDSVGPVISTALIPRLVNLLLPLAFKPAPAAFGTIGESFDYTKFRGKACSAAIGLDIANATQVLEEVIAINNKTPFPGALAFRYVKGTPALLGFTHFPKTVVLELDGVESNVSREFFKKVWSRLEQLNIPFTEHWGKINFNLNPQLIRKMYTDANVNKWISCRHQLLSDAARNVFNNDFLKQCGLDG